MELSDGYYGSPRWSYEVLDCAMPLTLDTYSNCAHQCVYCFSFFQRAIGAGKDDYLHHRVRAVNVERVKRMFIDPDRHGGVFAPYIKRRFVMQWGGLSDGFDWYEREFRKSLELLTFFRSINYPVSISTKGTWYLDDPAYVEAIRGASDQQHWKVSIITLDDDKAKVLEAGTAPPRERVRAMERLSALGVPVTLRFRPFIIGASEDSVDELFRMSADAGCISVSMEFLCLEKRATPNAKARYRAMSRILGYDVFAFYKRNSYSGAGLLRLNYDLKRPYVQAMQEAADKYGLRLVISDAHHKQGGACCGLPATGQLSNVARGQFAFALEIAKEKGCVRWSDISQDAEWLRSVKFKSELNVGVVGRARMAGMTFFDYMRHQWNATARWYSPARYFGGVLVPGDIDEQGDVIYYYNRPFVTDGTQVENVAVLRDACGGCEACG